MQEKIQLENQDEQPTQTEKNEEKNDFKESYQEAAEKSFWRIWKNRWLWLWGVVLPGGITVTFSYDYRQKDLMAQKAKIEPEYQQAMIFFQQYKQEIAIAVIILVFLFFFMWVASYVIRGGIIKALDQLQNSDQLKRFTFSEIWQKGRDKALELFKLDVLVVVFMISILLILGLPVLSLFMHDREDSAAMLYLLALLIYVPLSVLSYFIRYVGMVHIVSGNLKVWDSVERSYNLALKNTRESAKFFLMIFLIDVGKTLVMLVSFIIALIFAFLLGVLLAVGGLDEIQVTVISAALALMLLAVLILFIRSFFSLWSMDLWLWWTKKFGGIKAPEVVEKEESKVLAKTPEPAVGVENCRK